MPSRRRRRRREPEALGESRTHRPEPQAADQADSALAFRLAKRGLYACVAASCVEPALAGGGSGPGFLDTPSWRVAMVMIMFLVISFAVENGLHWLHHRLEGHSGTDHLMNEGRVAVLHTFKDELMLLGFLSFMLGGLQEYMTAYCVQKHSDTDYWTAATRCKAHEAYAEVTCNATAVAAYARRRQLASAAAGCGKYEEEFVSVNTLHQTHILIFLIALFHITYCCVVMLLTTRKVEAFDNWERWGDTEEERNMELTVPRDGWFASLLRSFVLPLSTASHFPVSPFTYMAMRNFFIIKHKLDFDFPFDDYVRVCVTHDFAKTMGIKSWMWLVITIRVLTDGYSNEIGEIISYGTIALEFIISVKMNHVANAIARRSYGIYDTDGNGKLSQHEIEEMQKLSEAYETDAGGVKRLRRGSVSVMEAEVSLKDDNFWFGSPKFLLMLIQYIMFENSTVFAFSVFHVWQIKESCYGSATTELVRICLALLCLAYLSLVILPTYAIVVEMGSEYDAESLNQVLKAMEAGEITKTKFDDAPTGGGKPDDSDSHGAHGKYDIESKAPHEAMPTEGASLPGVPSSSKPVRLVAQKKRRASIAPMPEDCDMIMQAGLAADMAAEGADSAAP